MSHSLPDSHTIVRHLVQEICDSLERRDTCNGILGMQLLQDRFRGYPSIAVAQEKTSACAANWLLQLVSEFEIQIDEGQSQSMSDVEILVYLCPWSSQGIVAEIRRRPIPLTLSIIHLQNLIERRVLILGPREQP